MINETTLRQAIHDWLLYNSGTRTVFTLTFTGEPFEVDDLITGTQFGSEHITPLLVTAPFTQTGILAEIARRITALDTVLKAVPTSTPAQIAVTVKQVGIDLAPLVLITNHGLDSGVHVVQSTVVQGTSLAQRIIRADQVDSTTGRNAPRPDSLPYIVFRVGSIRNVGQDESRGVDGDNSDLMTTIGQRVATVTIDYFGPKPMEGLSRCFDSLAKRSALDIFESAGLAVLQKEAMQNLTGMLETKFEERARFEFYVGLLATEEDDQGVIETFELTGTINDENGDPAVVVGPKVIDLTEET